MARSGASGVVGSLLDFAAMVLMVELLYVGYASAAAASALAGAVVVFVLNRYWAFRDPRPLGVRQLLVFAVVAGGSAVITAGVVHLLAGVLRVAYLAAKAVSAGVVFLTWSYPAQSRLVFAQRSST
jgi:putative flippase GtrA